MPKYFEKFNFVPSKQVPRELARKINPVETNGFGIAQPAKPVTGRNRVKAMVFMRKK